MNTKRLLKQWIGIVRECRESGRAVVSWCKDHNIDTRKYYYWLQKIHTAAYKALPPINKEERIVTLELHDSSMPTIVEGAHVYKDTAVADIVIRIGSAILEIHNNASASLIENAIRALNNAR